MKYIQYFEQPCLGQWNSHLPPYLIEACGSDGVIILDGRYSMNTCHNVAHQENNRAIYKRPAYRIMSGSSFLNSQPISPIIKF